MNAEARENRSDDGDRDDWPNEVNLHRVERRVSRRIGVVLVAVAGLRRGLVGVGLGLLGAALIHRGATGHCHVYSKLRVSTAHGRRGPSASVPHGQGVRVKHAVTVHQKPEAVYAFWRQLGNLPIFMHHIESVTVLDDGRSHWRARGPLGQTIEWEAKIINEVEGELIAWRSLEGSHIHHAGSVRFERALGGHGTLVTLTMEYAPPGGLFGTLAARLFGLDPDRQVEDDLRRLKHLLEVGEVPHIDAPWRGRLSELPDIDEARAVLAEDPPEDAEAANDETTDRRGVH
jgi:uncharacterized membrane protein